MINVGIIIQAESPAPVNVVQGQYPSLFGQPFHICKDLLLKT